VGILRNLTNSNLAGGYCDDAGGDAHRRPTPYHVNELAARWGVSPQAVTGALRRGTLRGFKFGRSWLVWPREVARIERGGAAAP
jgi:hypothetical protein